MIVPRAFLGAAGTGKTTRLMVALEETLRIHPLRGDQRVLALTRMHGSRHRLIERLAMTSAKQAFDCFTFDKIAWEVSSRWRSRVRELGLEGLCENDYDDTCAAGAAILAESAVVRWLVRHYPVIVIDELQDCDAGRLGMAKGLAGHAHLLLAADAFQNLDAAGASDAVDWVRRAALVEELTQVHRTSDPSLLALASAFRDDQPTPLEGRSARVFSAPKAEVAAGFLARGLKWAGRAEIVLLSAASPAKSPWVRDALKRLAAAPFEKDGQKFGPYTVGWERSARDLEAALCERLGLGADDKAVVENPLFSAGARLPAQPDVERWIANRRGLRGSARFTTGEVRDQIKRAVNWVRSFTPRKSGRMGMTIHQAKNREFDRVLILWPMAVKGEPEGQRRLLYNAVTRAKKGATIIVQDPTRARLSQPPFASQNATRRAP